MSATRRYRLKSIDGNVSIGPPGATLGRGLGCDVVVHDPLVSRRHATLHVEPHGIFVEDLGSSNGTLVNGARVRGRAKLETGDRLTIGTHQFVLVETKLDDRERPSQPEGTSTGSFERRSPTLVPPSPDEQPDEVTQAVPLLVLLIAGCERRLARGQFAEAASTAATVFIALRTGFARGDIPDTEPMERLALVAVELAERTSDRVWIERILDAYTAAERVLDLAIIDRLHPLLDHARSRAALERYVQALERKARRLDDDEYDRLSRLTELRDRRAG